MLPDPKKQKLLKFSFANTLPTNELTKLNQSSTHFANGSIRPNTLIVYSLANDV